MKNARGQAMVEFALVLPLCCVLGLGVVEVSYALLDQHVVTKLTREGSNLISRDTTLQDAATALKNMGSNPVDFTTSSTVIFSVIKRVGTTGGMLYVTEVFTKHTLITPFDKFGIVVPSTLYSIAYF